MESKDINEFTNCEYYNVSCGGICDQCTIYGNTSTTKCSDITNCFIKNLYKQLQDKEQENEKLKFIIRHTGLLDLMNRNVELKQVLHDIEQYIIKWAGLYFDEVCCKEILDILDKAKDTNKMEGQ